MYLRMFLIIQLLPGRVVIQNDVRVNDLDQIHLPDPVMNDIESLKAANVRLQREINELRRDAHKNAQSGGED